MDAKDLDLLKKLCAVRATSGDEYPMRSFLLSYIKKNQQHWKTQPQIFKGRELQDCLVLVFGKPRTAVFAHMDSIGFTVRYNNQLVKIGGPKTEAGYQLVGSDSQGEIECTLDVDKDRNLTYQFTRNIERGTPLSFKPDFKVTTDSVQCCYLDNRLGIFNALKLAEKLKDGILVFSCWEEHGGGSAEYLAKFIYLNYKIKQALISDITWVTEGVEAGKGAAISLRDSGIPRKRFTDKIIHLAQKSGIPFQVEVESSGGSDGNSIQRSPYPIDWCFIGAPEENVHSPFEKVHVKDIESMLSLYEMLLKEL